ncbi:unnamed protein product, partial [Pneumocystis jirovecii]
IIQAPLILSLQVQILVTFLCSFEEKEFLIPVLEKTISATVYRYPDNSLDDVVQTIRELRRRSGQELLRLAMELSDLLWNIYPQLEKIICEIINKKSSENENIVFNTFLLIISQKSTNTQDEKVYYFQYIITKLVDTWNKTKSMFNLATFDGFFDFLGLQKITQYIREYIFSNLLVKVIIESKNIHSVQDLNTKYLDIQGKQLVDELKEIRKMFWPIRGFRKFADYHLKIISFENNNNNCLLKLWESVINFILPDIFNIIRFKKLWSNNSSYMSIGSFSNFGSCFYKNPNLIQNIIESLFSDIKSLSLYTWSSILDFSISPLIIKCPYDYQDNFLKVLLPYLFTEIDKKLISEWSKIKEKELISNDDFNNLAFCQNEDLSDEIIQELLLRHLSFITVKLLRELLIPPNK